MRNLFKRPSRNQARTSLEIFKIFSYLSPLENENNENKKTRNLQPIRFRILQAAHRLSALDLLLRIRTILFSIKIEMGAFNKYLPEIAM